jgi:hypothetical protein
MLQAKDKRPAIPERFREILPESFLQNWSIAEERLLNAVAAGAQAVAGGSDLARDPANHPDTPNPWPEERRVRAELIRWLCTDTAAASRIGSHGIQLFGARISGPLDLANVKLSFPLWLLRCQIWEAADLSYVQIPSLVLSGSSLGWLDISYSRIRGDLALDESFSSNFGVTLYSANIGGDLDCVAGRFRADGRYALNAQQVTIDGSVFFSDGFCAHGGASLRAAHIRNDVSCKGGSFVANKDDPKTNLELAAFDAESAVVGGSIFLYKEFSATGRVFLGSTHIGAELVCDGGHFNNADGEAISAAGISVKGGVFLGNKFSAQGTVNLAGAQIGGNLNSEKGQFSSSSSWAINAEVITIGGSALLNDCTARGGVLLRAAHIRNELDCSNSRFTGNPGKQGTAALQAMSAVIGSGVLLNMGFIGEGAVSFDLAQIGGDFSCVDGNFKNGSNNSLSAESAAIKGSVFLRNRFSANGRVSLMSAQVDGDLDCEGGNFTASTGESLNAERAIIGGTIYFRKSFSAHGKVNLRSAHIRNDLDCSNQSYFVWNKGDDHALNASYAVVGGNIFFYDRFFAEGPVGIDLAQIGGDLDCRGGSFKNAGGVALLAESIVVKGGLYLNNKFSSLGKVSLVSAQISGDMDCQESYFSAPGGTALDAERATIGGSVFLHGSDGDFSADATVDFSEAQISRDMNCTRGSFQDVSLYGATIKQTLYWTEIKSIFRLKLSDLKVDTLETDNAKSWPRKGNLSLDGFTYRSVTGGFQDSDFRKDWLRLSLPFSEQPYTQLAKFLQDTGDGDGAKEVLSQMESDSRENARQRFNPLRKFENYGGDLLQQSTTGYGIYPLRAVYGLGLMAGLAWVIHRRAEVRNAMAPSEKEAYDAYHTSGKLPDHYPPFHPLIYSLENCIPLVKLGQDDKWQPDSSPLQNPHPPVAPAGKAQDWLGRTLDRVQQGWEWMAQRTIDPAFIRPNRLRWVRWILIMLGWILATFFAAGIAGIVKGG